MQLIAYDRVMIRLLGGGGGVGVGLYVLGNSCGHVRAISISNHTIPGQAWRPYSLVPFFDQWKKSVEKIPLSTSTNVWAGPGIEPSTYGSSVRLPTATCCLHICVVMASEKYGNQGVPLEICLVTGRVHK